jgi:hypothetical protein
MLLNQLNLFLLVLAFQFKDLAYQEFPLTRKDHYQIESDQSKHTF